MSFFPLDRGILSSSIWAQGTPEQVKVWFYLLLAANPRTGIVADADPGIALHCGLPLDVTKTALDWLESPDSESRTKAHEGRRIKRLETGGILVLNYETHRDADYSTPRVKRFRDRKQRNGVKRRSTVAETTDTDTTDGRTATPSANEDDDGTLVSLRKEIRGEMAQEEERTGKSPARYLAKMSKTSRGRVISNLETVTSTSWLRTTRDKMLEHRLSLEADEPERAPEARGPVFSTPRASAS